MNKALPQRSTSLTIISSLLLATSTLLGESLDPDNILVSLGQPTGGSFTEMMNQVLEFTTGGELVQTIQFKYKGGSYPDGEFLRDIEVDSEGFVEAVNGWFNPILTRFSPASGSFTDTILSGWHIYSTESSGKLATYQNFTFVADNSKDGQTPPPGGVLRFDRSTGTITRLAGDAGVDDVTMGLDGKLYAVYERTPGASGATNIDVYDPVTGAWLYTVDLPSPVTDSFGCAGIAVDSSGEIFGVGAWYLYRLSPDGTLQTSMMPVPEFEILNDIEVDEPAVLSLSAIRQMFLSARLLSLASRHLLETTIRQS